METLLTNMTAYFAGATLTFGILLRAFLKDNSTSKTDVTSWLVLAVGTLLWFITLPCILRQQVIAAKQSESTSSRRVTIPG